MRILLIFAALVLIYVIGKRLLTSQRPSGKPPAQSDRMVQCAHCGMYIPEHEAIVQDGQAYCSPAHRDAGPARRS